MCRSAYCFFSRKGTAAARFSMPSTLILVGYRWPTLGSNTWPWGFISSPRKNGHLNPERRGRHMSCCEPTIVGSDPRIPDGESAPDSIC
jgi:hypothetical protein